ncbi:MAG TPA: 8-amino-7-oxononanoate synthase [Nocardioidaceae bacterium]|nr:8-amino-7-oxononanoate synthase [Nocardioidaceae bacterium]
MSLQQWLAERADEREAAGLVRRLHPRAPQPDLLDLAGNDYLGLSTDPRVTEAAAGAARTWGAGASASRLVTGTLELHAELESALAAFCGQPAALVFSTGYHANLSIVTALADEDTLIVSDAHVHASLVDACRLSRARVVVTPHNDVAAVADALSMRTEGRALMLVESIFSVLGDAAPLQQLAAVCDRTDAVMIIDEAHGLGVAGTEGRGLVHDVGLAGHPGVVVSLTLSKALGSQGGAVLAPPEVVEQVVNRARPFIYDTGLAPPAAGAALAALQVLETEPERTERVLWCAARLAEAAGVDAPTGAVLSVPMPAPDAALAGQQQAAESGVRIGCFRPPSVPDGISRLRVTASSRLTDAEVDRACAVLARVCR